MRVLRFIQAIVVVSIIHNHSTSGGVVELGRDSHYGFNAATQDEQEDEDEDEDEDEEEVDSEDEDLDRSPVITEYNAQYDSVTDEWVVSGTVDDEDCDSCIIGFGLLLDSHTCEVEEDGRFEYRVHLDEEGIISLVVIDEAGNVSEERYDDIEEL